jgi:hypothetical protein
MKLIIYTNENGGLSILTPAPECGLPIEEVARKDVPAGVPYQIVDAADIPTDREFRDAWESNIIPDGVGIGADAWFAEQAELKAKQEVEDDNNQSE